MGSGEQATLNLTGDNFLQVAVPTNTKTADGRALVDVSGKVSAAGGMVQLKAATVAQAIRDAVNVPGELTVVFGPRERRLDHPERRSGRQRLGRAASLRPRALAKAGRSRSAATTPSSEPRNARREQRAEGGAGRSS